MKETEVANLRRQKDTAIGNMAKLRAARFAEFAIIRKRMEQKLEKQAEIHRLEVTALLDAGQ
jgi:hypothetical protein